MFELLSKSWKIFIFKGIFLITFAFIAILKPLWIAKGLVWWFGALFLTDGLLSFASGIRYWKENQNRILWIVEGLIGIFLGLLVILNLGIGVKLLAWVTGLWFILAGVSRIIMALRLKKEIESEGWILFNGILYIVIGLIFLLRPMAGAQSLIWVGGLTALAMGIVLIAIGWKFRKNTIFFKP